MHHVYIRFDGPRLFSCLSDSGQLYLSVFVEEDESNETYIYVAVSPERLAAIQSGHISLREAFADPANGGLWKVTSDGRWSWVESPIDSNWLPHQDARLDIESPTQQSLDVANLQVEARNIQRDIVAIELDSYSATTEYPLGPIARIMNTFQDTVDALGEIATSRPSDRGPIPRALLEETQLNLYGLRAASFAFLVSTDPARPKLFDANVVTSSLGLLMSLMGASSSPDELQIVMGQIHKRATSRYSELLEELDHSGSSVKVILAEPSGQTREVTMTKAQILASLGAARRALNPEEEEIQVDGLLIGVNERLHSFEIFDESLGRRYRGKADSTSVTSMIGLVVGQVYRVRLIDSKTIHSVTEQEEHQYRLIDIEPLIR